mmetsp:Transcript_34243/g.87117  ORF Transcript_34243/g.87117 Transcript_34243/m.87117 type:complete len:243 (-) Transcript_34243:624-1352(-)
MRRPGPLTSAAAAPAPIGGGRQGPRERKVPFRPRQAHLFGGRSVGAGGDGRRPSPTVPQTRRKKGLSWTWADNGMTPPCFWSCSSTGATTCDKRCPSCREPEAVRCNPSGSQRLPWEVGTRSPGLTKAATPAEFWAQAAVIFTSWRRALSKEVPAPARRAGGGAKATVGTPRVWQAPCNRIKSSRMPGILKSCPRSLVPAMIATRSIRRLCSDSTRRRPFETRLPTSSIAWESKFDTISATV